MTRQWRRERPDIDPESMAMFARLSRAQASAGDAIEATLSGFGINRGEFDVLASLRRSGKPFELSAGALAQAVVLSPSAMTNRLKRLEEHDLVTRRPDPANGRVVLVALTAGRATARGPGGGRSRGHPRPAAVGVQEAGGPLVVRAVGAPGVGD